MADKVTKVYNKIAWRLTGLTQERIETFKLGRKFDSSSTKIAIGDNITEWFLRVYPGGYNKESKDCIGLFLCLKGANSRHFKTSFILGIAGNNGNEETERLELSGESFVSYGYPDFLQRKQLFNFRLFNFRHLIDGNVMLYCKLTITSEEAPDPEGDKTTVMEKNPLRQFKRMMSDKFFEDFDIETSDKKVLKAHKKVLAFGSPYFYRMLTNDMKEAQTSVKVPENSAVMVKILRFIYYHEVENLSAVNFDLALAAEKYQLDDLEEICIECIIKKLTIENVVETLLAAAQLTKAEKLKDKCFDMVSSNYNLVKSSEQWITLPQSVCLELIESIFKENEDSLYV